MKKIIVAGTGSTAYLAVATLHQTTNNEIIWYKPDMKNIGVGEGTLPYVLGSLRQLGITDDILLNKLNSSVKLGVKFVDFGFKGNEFNFPFSPKNCDIAAIYNYFMNNDVFVPKFSELFSVHFDIDNVYQYFDCEFENYERLTIIKDKFDYDSEKIQDSFIIDATGFARSIVKALPNYKFKSYSDVIHNDQAYVYRRDYSDIEKQKKPYTTAIARDYGWIWNIPLANKIGVGYVHSSKYDVSDEFVEYLRSFHSDSTITKEHLRLIRFETGRNENSVYFDGSNIIFPIGLSNSFIEPMEATGLALTMFEIQELVPLINNPTKDIFFKMYNDAVAEHYDNTLKFVSFHYANSKRSGEYWDFYRSLKYSKKFYGPGYWPEWTYDVIEKGVLGDEIGYSEITGDTLSYIEENKIPFHKFNSYKYQS